MKIKYLIIGLLFMSIFACKKGDSYDLSIVTTFPVFEYDNTTQLVELGNDFPNTVVAMEGDKVLDVTMEGLNTNVVGAYTVVYTATNAEGYDGTVTQLVIVHDPTLTGTDVSGNINDIGRPERTGVISLVEGTSNIYYGSDMGFGGVFPLYFQMIGDVMHVIPQTFAFGATQVNATYDPVNRTFHTEILPYGFTYDFEYTTK